MTCIITQNFTLPQVFFKHFASKSQLPGLSVSGTLFENGLNKCAKNQIFLINSIFLKTDTHRFFHWFIECLLLAFDFIANWYRKKLSNIAVNDRYCLFLIFYIKPSKRELLLEIVKWTFAAVFVDRLHSTKFSLTRTSGNFHFYFWF